MFLKFECLQIISPENRKKDDKEEDGEEWYMIYSLQGSAVNTFWHPLSNDIPIIKYLDYL